MVALKDVPEAAVLRLDHLFLLLLVCQRACGRLSSLRELCQVGVLAVVLVGRGLRKYIIQLFHQNILILLLSLLDLRLEVVLDVPLWLLYVLLAEINILAHAAELLNLLASEVLDVLVLRRELLFASVVSVVSGYHRMHALVDCVLLVAVSFEAMEHFFDRTASADAFLMLLSPILFRVDLLRKYALCGCNVLGGDVGLFDGFVCASVVAIQILGHLPLIWDVEPAAVPSLF